MSAAYLLPCSCGKSVPVQISQAGGRVQCSCGTQLDVPTMRQLRQLERVEPEKTASGSSATWSTRHGLMLLGAIIVLAGLGPAIYFLTRLPEEPQPPQHSVEELIRLDQQRIDQMRLLTAWFFWKEGVVNHGLGPLTHADEIKYKEEHEAYVAEKRQIMQWLGFFGGVAGLGLLLAVCGFFWNPRRAGSRSG